MIMDARLRFAACFVLFASACRPDDNTTNHGFVVRDSAGVRIVENVLPETVPACSVSDPVVTIGEAAGREEYELYRVFGARRLGDGRIVVVNQGSDELRYYDPNGTFLRRAGRGGDGPGEFRGPFYLWVTAADTLWVGDYRPWRFQVFTSEGEWVRTVQPTPEYVNSPGLMVVLADGRSVLAPRDILTNGGNFGMRTLTTVLHDATGAIQDTVGTFANGRWGKVGDDARAPFLYPLFEAFTYADGAGEHWYIGHSSDAEVSVYSADPRSTLESRIRWTTGDRTVRSSDIATEKDRIATQYADMDPAMARMMVDPLISDERPVADRFPAFRGIAANRSGGFWISEYPRPDNPSARRWLSFDSDGRFVCQVAMPDAQIVDLGADYVLVQRSTALGVEQVVLFEVGAPGL